MTRYYPHTSLFIALCLMLFSCEEPIDFELSQEQRLVVISNFSDQKVLEVFVSKTKSVLSNEAISYRTDATVMVFSGNELLEVLELVTGDDGRPPFYRTTQLTPQPGIVYTIKVSVPGFEPVTATSSVPIAVPIQSVNFSNTSDEDSNHDVAVNFNVVVDFQDPPGEKNYYHLVFYQELTSYLLNSEGDTLMGNRFLNTPLSVQSSDPNMPAIKYFDNRSFLLKDDTFDGQHVSLPFKGNYTYSLTSSIPGNFFIELRTVTEDYYLYHSTLTRQVNSGNPLSDGVVIYDNIVNGEGIFAGYSSNTNSFSLGN
ncbi:MAG: DUF4249 domain-containing protein [Saprospiraceae bacterium]|nr:MAG: DUF4249 domain-containing protein [Saprospiraceae bacterium]